MSQLTFTITIVQFISVASTLMNLSHAYMYTCTHTYVYVHTTTFQPIQVCTLTTHLHIRPPILHPHAQLLTSTILFIRFTALRVTVSSRGAFADTSTTNFGSDLNRSTTVLSVFLEPRTYSYSPAVGILNCIKQDTYA